MASWCQGRKSTVERHEVGGSASFLESREQSTEKTSRGRSQGPDTVPKVTPDDPPRHTQRCISLGSYTSLKLGMLTVRINCHIRYTQQVQRLMLDNECHLLVSMSRRLASSSQIGFVNHIHTAGCGCNLIILYDKRSVVQKQGTLGCGMAK